MMASSPPTARIEVEYICRNSMKLTLPSYFNGKWGQNLHGQTTMWRCGASNMQPPPKSHQGHRGVSSLPHRGGVHRIKVPIEVATLEAMPLPLLLNGDATILA
jgi:hypothetical protein